MEQIENQLLALVKGCLNDKEFLLEPKRMEGVYTSFGTIHYYTGVSIGDNALPITETIDNEFTVDIERKIRKIITLTFEKEPSITISAEQTSNSIKEEIVDVEIDRPFNGIIELFLCLFKSNTITKKVKRKIINYTYEYKLVCGDFKIALTNEEVDELVDLYKTNIIKFNKEIQAEEIMERIKKYVK